jgi:hypothetical protein
LKQVEYRPNVRNTPVFSFSFIDVTATGKEENPGAGAPAAPPDPL